MKRQAAVRRRRRKDETMSDQIVMTVLGPLPADRLGTTLTHEHCLVDLTNWFFPPKEASRTVNLDRPVDMSMLYELKRRPFSTCRDNIVLNDVELCIEELQPFLREGGQSIVDPTTINIGRDPIALKRISRATGINIVCMTGFYVESAHPDWVADMDADQLAELMTREIVEGIDDTGVHPGAIGEIGITGIPKGWGRRKVGPMTPQEEKVLRAAARASLATGLTVTVHTDPVPPRSGQECVDLLEEEGVDPTRIVIDHSDQVNDLDYHLALAARGVYVEFDALGREHYQQEWGYDFDWGHDSWRVRFAKRLIEAGHGDQLLFSHDVCLKTDLRKYGGPGYAHIFENIVPMLRAIGVGQSAIDRILVDNPQRAFGAPASAFGAAGRTLATAAPAS
jgi:phosphotriesterase-related protein